MLKLLPKLLFLLLIPQISSSCKKDHCYFTDNYATLSHYSTKNKKVSRTPEGITVYLNGADIDLKKIDDIVDSLEICLGIKIHRECFEIYIPTDWYISTCSGEQLLPIAAPHEQCEAKGLELPENCWGLNHPTDACPCVCNYRVSTQRNFLIVVTPNLKLLKAELARLVTGVNNPWIDNDIKECL